MKNRSKKLHSGTKGEIRHYVEDLLNRDWIKHSESPYSSPVVCVRKRDGDYWLCTDYRELYRQTVRNQFPLPKVQETLETLGGGHSFFIISKESLPSRFRQTLIVAHDCLHNPLWTVWVGSHTIRSHECPRGVSKVYAECTRGDE